MSDDVTETDETNHEKGNRNETEARNLLARVYGKGNVDKVDAASNSDPLGFIDILAAKDPFPVRFVQVKTNTFALNDRKRYASKASRYPESVVCEVWVRVDYEGWNCYRFDRESEEWERFLSMDTCDIEETAQALRDKLDFYEVIGRAA